MSVSLSSGVVSAPELVMFAVHWLCLWLGFHFLSRKPRSAALVLVAGAFIALSSYYLSSALLFTPAQVPAGRFWGVWLGIWEPFAPALLLFSFLAATRLHLPRQRLVVVLVAAFAALICVLQLSDSLIYQYSPSGMTGAMGANGSVTVGPLYPLRIAQMMLTLAVALYVLWRARRAHPRPAEQVLAGLGWLLRGTGLMFVAAALMFANMVLGGSFLTEMLLDPLLIAGLLIVAVSLTRYPGLLEGQLLRADLKASLLGATLVMTLFVLLALALGGAFTVLAALGWLLLAVFVFADDLHGLADRAFFGAGARAQRAALRATAAYAGSGANLDFASLAPGQSAGVIGLMSEVDRAASTCLEGERDPRLALLAREEFAAVREALALPAAWGPDEPLPREAIRAAVAERLEPRQRQALGLRYLGYADKEMAALMGVRPGVPRSYLSEAKRKLGLAAGAPLMLYVHFAGLAEGDALALVAAARGARAPAAGGEDAAPSGEAAPAAPEPAAFSRQETPSSS